MRWNWKFLCAFRFLVAPTWQCTCTSGVRDAGVFRGNGSSTIQHPAYSLDLAPCDFALFPYVKLRMKGRHFLSDEEVDSRFLGRMWLDTKKMWDEWFDEWFRRMKKCINRDEMYFERLWKLSMCDKNYGTSHVKLNCSKILPKIDVEYHLIIFSWDLRTGFCQSCDRNMTSSQFFAQGNVLISIQSPESKIGPGICMGPWIGSYVVWGTLIPVQKFLQVHLQVL